MQNAMENKHIVTEIQEKLEINNLKLKDSLANEKDQNLARFIHLKFHCLI